MTTKELEIIQQLLDNAMGNIAVVVAMIGVNEDVPEPEPEQPARKPRYFGDDDGDEKG